MHGSCIRHGGYTTCQNNFLLAKHAPVESARESPAMGDTRRIDNMDGFLAKPSSLKRQQHPPIMGRSYGTAAIIAVPNSYGTHLVLCRIILPKANKSTHLRVIGVIARRQSLSLLTQHTVLYANCRSLPFRCGRPHTVGATTTLKTRYPDRFRQRLRKTRKYHSFHSTHNPVL